MSKYLRGKKRDAVINNWLQGIEDPNFEIIPTSSGKYIVRNRENANANVNTDDENAKSEDNNANTDDENVNTDDENVNTDDENVNSEDEIPKVKKNTKVVKTKSANKSNIGKSQFTSKRILQNPDTETKILEYLEFIGNEMKKKKEKKKLDKHIKHVLEKKLSKNQQVNEEQVDENVSQNQPIEEIPQENYVIQRLQRGVRRRKKPLINNE